MPDGNLDQLVDDHSELLSHHQNLSSMHLPKTKLGAIRSGSIIRYCFDGLIITEENVESLLILSHAPEYKLRPNQLTARNLIEIFQRHSELIIASQHTINELEEMWTGQKRLYHSKFQSATEVDVYAILEYRCFIDQSWNVIRQLTCLSISKRAFQILTKIASSKVYQPGELSNVSRKCPGTVVYHAIECLLSFPPLQTLQSALARTVLSLRPGRTRDDAARFSQPTIYMVLKFHTDSPFWIRQSVQKILWLATRRPPGEKSSRNLPKQLRRPGGRDEEFISKYRRSTADRSFTRQSGRIADDTRKEHIFKTCDRCIQEHKGTGVKDSSSTTESGPFAVSWTISSTHNTILVQGAQKDPSGKIIRQGHGHCLFIIGNGPDLSTFAGVVEAHVRSGTVYHTILQKLEPSQLDCGCGNTAMAECVHGVEGMSVHLYTSSNPRRASTETEFNELQNWIMELQKAHVSPPKRPLENLDTENGRKAKRGKARYGTRE
ncbi:hypothetical protein F5Y16DRAFT_110303 [Xylariaceae sp. FL0255]|nr:hypothetical protein F5Y16DRAFT_110303 [Xylariaceae sp. FL0255]